MAPDTRWFRRLLRLLPADFQADYARDMERTFRAQHRDAHERGMRGLVRLWLETIADLLRTAPRQHADQIRQDVSYAVRTMTRRPGFTTVAVLVLALGIAATTAIFSIVDAAILRPVPFDDADRLVVVSEQTPQETAPWELSYLSYVELRRDAASFEQLATFMRNGVIVGGREPVTTLAALVSANLLETLRVRPAAGRGFTAAEDRLGGDAAVLVSHRLAQARFASAAAALGQAIVVDDRPTPIVGVLDETFRFPDAEVDVWLPIGQLGDEPWMRNRAVHVAIVVGRLRRDVSLAAARAELSAWMNGVQAREPAADPHHRIAVRLLASHVSAHARPAVGALAGAVLLLLAVTCTSVGLLFLTLAARRSGEMAVRLALGASRARIVRQLVTEAVCLAVLGAGIGIAAAHALLAFLARGLQDALPPLVAPAIGAPAIAAAVLTATAAAVVCGLAPAATALSPVRSTGPERRSRPYLLITQMAISCALVVIAMLLGRSLDRLLRVDLGFNADRLLVMRVNAPNTIGKRPGGMTRFYERASARLRELPGVSAVAAVSATPLQPGMNGDLSVEGQPRRVAPVATYRRVLPGYFATLGIPVVEGHDFTERDGTGEPVVLVSASLARRFWPPGHAVGKRLRVGPPDREPWLRIVGVVGDVRNGALDGGADLSTYEPHAQRPWNGMFMAIRTAGNPSALVETVRQALREVEPEVLVSAVSTMEERIAASVASRRFHTVVVGAFAGSTLLLVALALYGSLAYSVAARTREIGIRSAIGASAATLRREVILEGLRPTLAGLVVGLAGGGAAALAGRALLFEVTPGDAWTYAATAIVLFGVALASSWLPARRAARIEPSVALRAE